MLCKPDALAGGSSVVSGTRASAFLLTLASICASEHDSVTVPPQHGEAAEAARRQVRERAETESSFRGEVQDSAAVIARLCTRARSVAHLSGVPVRQLLIEALEGLGFRIVEVTPHQCTAEDVGNIYGFDPYAETLDSVPRQLLGYLAGQPTLVVRIEGTQSGATLEWWKTAARHILIDREGSNYLLVNLVHVCERSDAAYLSSLRRQATHGETGS